MDRNGKFELCGYVRLEMVPAILRKTTASPTSKPSIARAKCLRLAILLVSGIYVLPLISAVSFDLARMGALKIPPECTAHRVYGAAYCSMPPPNRGEPQQFNAGRVR